MRTSTSRCSKTSDSATPRFSSRPVVATRRALALGRAREVAARKGSTALVARVDELREAIGSEG